MLGGCETGDTQTISQVFTASVRVLHIDAQIDALNWGQGFTILPYRKLPRWLLCTTTLQKEGTSQPVSLSFWDRTHVFQAESNPNWLCSQGYLLSAGFTNLDHHAHCLFGVCFNPLLEIRPRALRILGEQFYQTGFYSVAQAGLKLNGVHASLNWR